MSCTPRTSTANSMAAAVEEQSAATGDIARTVQETATNTRRLSDGMSTIGEAMATTDAASHAVSTARQSLEEQLGRLNRDIEQFLARFLAAPVEVWQRRLRGGGEHDRAAVFVFHEHAQKRIGKPEVALHKLFLLFRAVHPGKVKHKLAFRAVMLQQFQGCVRVKPQQVLIAPRLQRGNQISPDEPLRASD